MKIAEDELICVKEFAECHMSEYPVTCSAIRKLIKEYERLKINNIEYERLLSFRENKS